MTVNFFAPQLLIPSGVTDISFYMQAFDARTIHRWNNDDGSVHIAELSIDGALFHLHEEKPQSGECSPQMLKGVSTIIGLFTEDVDDLILRAMGAGAVLIDEAKTFEYGYRQGKIKDPFGHIWLIEGRV
jgi:PhnB protein